MTPERHRRIKAIFAEASKLHPQAVASFLETACAHDGSLRREVESLLAHDRRMGRFLEEPAVQGLSGAHLLEVPTTEPQPLPERIGAYKILAKLGEGGMGVVYKAEQRRPCRVVALKVVRPEIATGRCLRRFEQESTILARLKHPGIAQVYEAGTAEIGVGACPFFAMELVDGLPVTRFAIERDLSIRARLELLAKVCDAVHHAHQKGVIHRDLKPANVLVDSGGQPKVLDFGVARATDSDVQVTTLRSDIGSLIGTVPYMSPEQVAGDPLEVDTQADVYALGVLGYELLTGRQPYDLADRPIPEAISIIGQQEATPLSSINRLFRGDVNTIFGKAMEKDKHRRYQSAAEFASDLRRYLNDEPIMARPASTLYQLRKFTRRNSALVVAMVLAFAALSVGVVGTAWQGMRAREQLRTVTEVNLFLRDLLELPFTGEQGRDITVLELFGEAADELEKRFPDKPAIKGPIYLAIGNTYQQVGLVNEAEHHVRAALQNMLEAYGERHAETVNAMAWLVLVLDRKGKLEEAERMARRTCALSERLLGRGNAYAQSAKVNLANVMRQRGDTAESERLLRDALEVLRRAQMTESLTSLYAEVVLAKVLAQTDKLVEAEAHADVACRGFLHTRGADDWRTLLALSTKARVQGFRGRFDEAESLMRRVLEHRRAVLGADHPHTVSSLYDLGLLLTRKGDYDQALALTEDALDRAKRALRPEHYRVARLESLYGACLLKLGRYTDAAKVLPAAHQRLAMELGRAHVETQNALRHLEALQQAMARSDPAASQGAGLWQPE